MTRFIFLSDHHHDMGSKKNYHCRYCYSKNNCCYSIRMENVFEISLKTYTKNLIKVFNKKLLK